ncbi:MAG: hypothetical protein ACI841_003601 [Planctomycetota bacterium]|jgi:hypothetical protein
MTQSSLIGIVGGALAGGLCAGALTMFASPAATLPTEAPLTTSSVTLDSLGKQLRELRDSNQALMARLEMLEIAPVATSNERISASQPEVAGRNDAFEQKLQQLVASMDSPGAAASPVILGAVTNALQTIREQEERDEQRQRDERTAEEMEKRITDLTEKLGLDKNQSDQMRTLLTSESIARSDLFTKARESGDFGSVRDGMRELRETTQTELGTFLSPTQMEQYESSGRDSGRGGFGRGGGGGDTGRTDRGDGGGGRRG